MKMRAGIPFFLSFCIARGAKGVQTTGGAGCDWVPTRRLQCSAHRVWFTRAEWKRFWALTGARRMIFVFVRYGTGIVRLPRGRFDQLNVVVVRGVTGRDASTISPATHFAHEGSLAPSAKGTLEEESEKKWCELAATCAPRASATTRSKGGK